jgi:AcrR family transcriptional regulator
MRSSTRSKSRSYSPSGKPTEASLLPRFGITGRMTAEAECVKTAALTSSRTVDTSALVATIFSTGMAQSDRTMKLAEPMLPAEPKGPRGLAPEQVAHNQRRRLEVAMVESVARRGYAGTTLHELVQRAGVSKTTFYEHFDSKQECFLATFDEVVLQIAERVSTAYREEGDFRERLVRGLSAFMDLAVTEPEAVLLTAVESLTLGKVGLKRRERDSESFEVMIRQSFEHSPSNREVQPATVRAIAAGIRGVVYRRVRAGRPEELPDLVDGLVDWALAYQCAGGRIVKRAAAAATTPQAKAAPGRRASLGWDEPPASPRSRAELTQRDRIVRAVGRLVVEKGYETLSISSISAAAGTSNQTFYEHFSSKSEAFLAAFDVTAAEGMLAVSSAFEAAGDGPEAVGAGLRALLEHAAANELFARLVFFDLQTAGPVALDRADAVMDSFIAFFQARVASMGADRPVSRAILEAVGSGAWSVIQHELFVGNTESLPDLAPELVSIVLTPFASC